MSAPMSVIDENEPPPSPPLLPTPTLLSKNASEPYLRPTPTAPTAEAGAQMEPPEKLDMEELRAAWQRRDPDP